MQGEKTQEKPKDPVPAGSLSVEDLRLLAALGRQGSLTGAARLLAVDHSTAFRRLGALEARLGARLFDRARDGYVATPAGERAIATAQRVLGELDDLERQLAGEDLRPSGRLRVTTADTLVEFLMPVFAAFRTAHPEVLVELVVANTFFTLTRRDADVAVRPAHEPGDAFVGRKVATLGFAVYGAHRRYARARAVDFQNAAWIGFEESLSDIAAARWMTRHVDPARIAQTANSMSAVRSAVRAGIGIAPLPCFLGDPLPDLVRIGGLIEELRQPLWLLTHPDLRRVARVRVFLDFAAAAIGDLRSVLEGTANSRS
jgi:DNA-binding transcriptional LysR family regulator